MIDRIVEQYEVSGGNKQQVEMLRQMLKEKLKNSSLEDILKEAGLGPQ